MTLGSRLVGCWRSRSSCRAQLALSCAAASRDHQRPRRGRSLPDAQRRAASRTERSGSGPRGRTGASPRARGRMQTAATDRRTGTLKAETPDQSPSRAPTQPRGGRRRSFTCSRATRSSTPPCPGMWPWIPIRRRSSATSSSRPRPSHWGSRPPRSACRSTSPARRRPRSTSRSTRTRRCPSSRTR